MTKFSAHTYSGVEMRAVDADHIEDAVTIFAERLARKLYGSSGGFRWSNGADSYQTGNSKSINEVYVGRHRGNVLTGKNEWLVVEAR